MKKKIHPKYNKEVEVTCACGNKFLTGSVLEKISIELCSKCHPFYTGKQKLVDTAKRIDKFKNKLAKKDNLKNRKGKTAKRQAKAKAQEAKKTKK